MLIEAAGAASSVLLYSQLGLRRRSVSPGGHWTATPLLSPNPNPHRSRLSFVAGATDSTQPAASASVAASSQKTIIADNDFSLAKVSFGVIGLAVGGTLLSYGFGAYFTILPGSEWSALMLTYGFPLAIIGMALKYAELKPVPCITYSDAESFRETCATPILKQVRNDVIRYRYGDEQHLDEALKRIFQYGQGGGIPRRSAPILQMIREEVTEDGKYCLVLVFEAKALELSEFEKRQIATYLAVHRDGSGSGSAADELSDTIVVPGLPQRIEMSKNQAPDWVPGRPVASRETELEEAGDGVIFNTFYEMEAEFVELYKKAIGKPVWTMGPLALHNKDVAMSAARDKKSAIDEHQVLSWLDSMQPKSVLLASFGSLVPVKPSQLIEVGCGLEASGRPFIWVIKEHDKSPGIDKWMSEGFLERTKDRSLVITGWVPQVAIQSHPSVGGFLTHCGWDSVLEAVAAGVPTITWPHLADQFLNEKLIVDVLDIGVSLGVTVPIYDVKEDEVPVKSKDIEKAISRLMDGTEECEARRARAAILAEKAKKSVEEGGSSCENLEAFIEYIMEKSK